MLRAKIALNADKSVVNQRDYFADHDVIRAFTTLVAT